MMDKKIFTILHSKTCDSIFQLAMGSFYEGDPADDDDLSPALSGHDQGLSVQGQGLPPGQGVSPSATDPSSAGPGASAPSHRPSKPASR